MSLPIDVIVEIFNLLPLRDLTDVLMLVCKAATKRIYSTVRYSDSQMARTSFLMGHRMALLSLTSDSEGYRAWMDKECFDSHDDELAAFCAYLLAYEAHTDNLNKWLPWMHIQPTFTHNTNVTNICNMLGQKMLDPELDKWERYICVI
jgi:hypothetical protein